MIRIVGLSATLPNYEDVAAFLHVSPSTGEGGGGGTSFTSDLQQGHGERGEGVLHISPHLTDDLHACQPSSR